jgi:tRNA pseudouridine55 synthase
MTGRKSVSQRGAFFVATWKRMRYDERIMEQILNIYKPQGMTPLQALDAVRRQYPEYRDMKMTYAGRLDPMAEGVLVVLVGDAVHRKEEYLGLDKVYEADIVFGIGTDTHDLLGMPELCGGQTVSDERREAEIRNMRGIFEYPFPKYSSKPVNGKPLFQWAREGKLDEIEIPKREMCVYDIEILDRYGIEPDAIRETAKAMISNIKGDFRQVEILRQWDAVLRGPINRTVYPAVRVRIHCASGTYIRTLVYELGKRLGTDAVLMRLVRTRVGDFDGDGAVRLND